MPDSLPRWLPGVWRRLYRQVAQPAGVQRPPREGTCSNGHVIRVPELERRLLDELKALLLARGVLPQAVAEYHRERKRLAGEATSRRAELERRIATLNNEIAASSTPSPRAGPTLTSR